MRFILIIILLPAFSMCQTTKPGNVNYVKRYDYVIEVAVANGFGGTEEKYVLNNVNATGANKTFKLQKYTYSIRENKKDSSVISFSAAQSDRLFGLTKAFFSNLSLNNTDSLVNGQATEVELADDSNATISLAFRGNKFTANIKSIANPANSNELMELLKYLWSLFPAK